MRSCRGPIFDRRDGENEDESKQHVNFVPLLPASRSSSSTEITNRKDSGFEPLPLHANEPSGEELALLVDEFYASNVNSLGSMGESDTGVVFQGHGDPLATINSVNVVIDTVRLLAQKRNGIAIRLNTLGLCGTKHADLLLSSGVLALSRDEDSRRDTRIATISVFLPAANPVQYSELLQPHQNKAAFNNACAFVARMAEEGVSVECTAVSRPDVAVGEVEALARSLGATSFRTRSWMG